MPPSAVYNVSYSFLNRKEYITRLCLAMSVIGLQTGAVAPTLLHFNFDCVEAASLKGAYMHMMQHPDDVYMLSKSQLGFSGRTEGVHVIVSRLSNIAQKLGDVDPVGQFTNFSQVSSHAFASEAPNLLRSALFLSLHDSRCLQIEHLPRIQADMLRKRGEATARNVLCVPALYCIRRVG